MEIISDFPCAVTPPVPVPRVHQLRGRDHLRVRARAEGRDRAAGEGGRRGGGGGAEGRRRQGRHERDSGCRDRRSRRRQGFPVQLLHALAVLQEPRPSPADEEQTRGCVYERGGKENCVSLVTVFIIFLFQL